jgi:hypothetical protein
MVEGLGKALLRYSLRLLVALLMLALPLIGGKNDVSHASGGLDLVRDYVYTTAAGEVDVTHDIYFVLPPSAMQIRTTDWIIVDLPNFENVRGNNVFVSGGFGTPNISQVGKRTRITNLALLPGTGLSIGGIVADNPPAGNQQVIITIAEDAAGTVVRNQAITIPIQQGGYVSISATISSPLSSLSISGYTAAAAFITLSEDGSVLATEVADTSGYFQIPLTALIPGPHVYTLFSSDNAGRNTSATILNLFLIESTLTTVTGILLSPTITVDKSEINPGETITISGTAKPTSLVNIFLEAPLQAFSTSTNAAGEWTFTLSGAQSSALSPGQYRFYTNVQDNFGAQSITSPTAIFLVKSPDGANPPAACNISTGDLNCDGVTNLVDFSILLFHWQTNHRVADINGDGMVNLTDFSIMMFYFQR